MAVPLLDCLPGVPRWVAADRGDASHAFREHIRTMGARLSCRDVEELLAERGRDVSSEAA